MCKLTDLQTRHIRLLDAIALLKAEEFEMDTEVSEACKSSVGATVWCRDNIEQSYKEAVLIEYMLGHKFPYLVSITDYEGNIATSAFSLITLEEPKS